MGGGRKKVRAAAAAAAGTAAAAAAAAASPWVWAWSRPARPKASREVREKKGKIRPWLAHREVATATATISVRRSL